MEKPDFDEESMTPEKWKKLLDEGMNDLYKEFASKGIAVTQRINGKIVKEVPSINSKNKSFTFKM